MMSSNRRRDLRTGVTLSYYDGMRELKPMMVRLPPELDQRLSRAADGMMIPKAALARTLIKQQLDYWDREEEYIEGQGGNGENAGLPKLTRQQRRAREREAKKRQ